MTPSISRLVDRARKTRHRLAIRVAVALAVVAAVLSSADTAGALTISPAEIERRDQLIAAQDKLLNVYRCRFEADVSVVPGGCHEGSPVNPAINPEPFDGLPTVDEIATRDKVIASKRIMLNVYRCYFEVDTSLVNGGCRDGWPAGAAEEPAQPATDSELSPAEIYERMSPSIPLVETQSKQGSGVLIEGGYILTNHHVVWPYDRAWVVFPDGTEFEDVPVVGWDFMADLAVLGPVDVQLPPLNLGSASDLPPGGELVQLGYPSEPELFPQPTITRGILSRGRQWDAYGLTLLQTDAAIAGGQSGGAVLNLHGEVIGISTWRFSQAGFTLATSASDDALIVERLILEGLVRQHDQSQQESSRRASNPLGEFTHTVSGTSGFDSPAFTFEASAGTKVTIRMNGIQDGVIIVSDSNAILVSQDGGTTGLEQTTFEVRRDGKHFVRPYSRSEGDFQFELSSSVRLRMYEDEADGTAVAVSSTRESIYGFFDYPLDIDWYRIALAKDETIEINTDAIIADTAISVRNPETGESVKSDGTDPLTGLGFAENAQLTFTAPTAGEYYIYVEEVSGARDQGYALIVERLKQ